MRFMLLFLLAVTALSGQALAWEARPVCTRYIQDAPDAPAEVNEIAKQYGNGAAMICRNQQAWPVSIFYFSLSKIQKGHFGVCSFGVKQVFEYQTPAGLKFDSPPPNDYRLRSFMALSDGDCPAHDHGDYILTDSVTEGIFVEFMKVWSSIRQQKITDDMFIADRSMVEPYKSIGSLKSFTETVQKYGSPHLEYFGKRHVSAEPYYQIGFYFSRGPANIKADITRDGLKMWDFGRSFGD
ncbi:hypothetical protein [Ferrovibrio terrae]|uniref:hypothetical protein n=1 Tax=Ferrovibrio terrae TaxID=2594003 RepID=UPI003137F70A